MHFCYTELKRKKKRGGKNDVAIRYGKNDVVILCGKTDDVIRCGKNDVCHMTCEKWCLNYVVGRIMLKI